MIKAGIVGYGLSGEVLLKILLGHPEVESIDLMSEHLTRGDSKKSLQSLAKSVRGGKSVHVTFPDSESELKNRYDVLFFCKPNAVSMKEVPKFLKSSPSAKIIDIAADFRLKNAGDFKKWYGAAHACPQLLKKAVYGLCELNREKIKKAQIAANPGCYPTAALLALAPLLKEKLIESSGVIVDAYSGISGAGATANEKNLFMNVYGNLKAYSAGGIHRHIPEMEQEASLCYGKKVSISFTPHLAPVDRGILTTVYAKPKKTVSEEKLVSLFQGFYAGEPFVKVVGVDECGTQSVHDTNDCLIAPVVDARTGKLIVFSALDNLVKGAAGQAVQNMNLMFGLEETMGLV